MERGMTMNNRMNEEGRVPPPMSENAINSDAGKGASPHIHSSYMPDVSKTPNLCPGLEKSIISYTPDKVLIFFSGVVYISPNLHKHILFRRHICKL
jgi:hypothetical protein